MLQLSLLFEPQSITGAILSSSRRNALQIKIQK